MPTSLYRFFDASGQLLYVGVSNNITRRWTQHQAIQPWWFDVVTASVEHYETRGEALEAELTAIRQESPIHNIAGVLRERESVDDRYESMREAALRVTCPDCGAFSGYWCHAGWTDSLDEEVNRLLDAGVDADAIDLMLRDCPRVEGYRKLLRRPHKGRFMAACGRWFLD